MIKIFQKIKSFIKVSAQRFYFLCKHHKLLNFLAGQYKLSAPSFHGAKHWFDVSKIGADLCLNTGADYEMVFLFAYLHDIARINDDYDPKHGQRAATLIKKLYSDRCIKISQDQLELLAFVCRHHNNSDIKSDNITIQTCWDADRLDLWRIGIIPDKQLLHTDIAKSRI